MLSSDRLLARSGRQLEIGFSYCVWFSCLAA
nr:MAG TPA: hypothetical protein [Microviridae sp.]